jgi:phage tail sheath protein FI
MARSINSPGVQIIETDLSNYQQVAGGTTVFVPGFAAQGPTDEVILITTAAELDQVYGAPETPAERYFYYSCKEVLNSPATLLTTRLPYGSGSGEGFTNSYGALFYPVASSANGFTIGRPIHKTLDIAAYNNIIQNNFSWSTVSESTSAATFDGSNVNAGIIILNTSQTTQNEFFEGYYVSLADNTDFGPNTNFTSVVSMSGFVESGVYSSVPLSKLEFSLSATKEQVNSNSISEVIESVPTFNFGDNYYSDSLILNVWKVRNSIYEPQTLVYSVAETHIGSLDADKKTVAEAAGGTKRSFFLEDVSNNNSSNLKVFVNPNISKLTNWSSLSSNNPSKTVRIDNTNKAMYATGTFVPTYANNASKVVGNIVLKSERALSLVETPETIFIDVVVDAGLSTIHATVTGESVSFDDTTFYNATTLLNSENSALATRWRSLFNVYNTFVQNTRKDCVYIADPLRQIFVNGADTKTLSVRGNTFSTNIYTPLKNLFSTINSNYAATYANWVKQYDAYSDSFVWLPASGHVAAIFARTDTNAQPWIAPAGLNRGIINNIVDLGFNPNQKQRDFLYTLSLNPIVSFPGDGFAVFGQKTLQNKPSAFDRINVRRLFLTLERATQRTLKYFVFEPNTEFTRTRLKNTIVPIFELAKNTEGLYDYLIVCDERNNTPDVIDRNELAVDIYIKPVKAAEFILVNFIATRTGQNFQELI